MEEFTKAVIDLCTKAGGKILLAIIVFIVGRLIIGKIVNVSALSIGGTSVIIVVGVALETVRMLEAQMLMRHYKGFLE